MNKFLIASCLLAFAIGWTVNINNVCSCNQLVNQGDCGTHAQCAWSTSSTCQSYNCTAQTTSGTCNLSPTCYWNTTGNSCGNFESCSKLSFNSLTLCTSANSLCSYNTSATSASTCIDNQCSLYSTTNCSTQPGGSTLGCVVSGTTCVQATACSSFLDLGNCTRKACYWNATATTPACVPATCASLSTASCNYILSSPVSGNVVPCVLNGTTTQNCIDAIGGSNFTTQALCYTNTGGLYYWSSNTDSGSCTACYGVLLQIVFAIILLLA